MTQPGFWDHRDSAQETVAAVRSCRNILTPFEALETKVGDFVVLGELVSMEGEESDMLPEADGAWQDIERELDRLELMSFLGGRMDANNAFLGVHAGAGGTESCDWAAMLLRMYTRWAEHHGFKVETVDYQPGDEAGIKSATILINGEYVYGYLKNECGVHRLVRVSPFDSNSRRHTSFAAVDVVAEIDEDIEIDINDGDIRMDTFRASGAGGQHVNRTDSAVRLTHVPTGIVVSCQQERSQHKNHATAMKLLKARLYEVEQSKRDAERAQDYSQKAENAWGSQIRSYVLYPYQMIKDLRTEVETSNTQSVLDGDLDMFLEAMLRHKK